MEQDAKRGKQAKAEDKTEDKTKAQNKTEKRIEKRIEKIVRRIASLYKPSSMEIKKDFAYIEDLKARLQKVLPEGVELKLVGSISKGTALKGEKDADLFVLFPKSFQGRSQEMSEIVLKSVESVKNPDEKVVLRYANHKYATLVTPQIKIDVVPAFKISSPKEMGTAVDRSPFHTDFINAHFDEYMRAQVRALKVLLKRNYIYGAESRIKGFSGYLCEVLILYYGSLLNLLKEASKWKPKVILDYNNKGGEHPADYSYFPEEFVVVDPTDPKRNIAAQVSYENFVRFILLSRRVLRNPSEELFEYPSQLPKIPIKKWLVLQFDNPKDEHAKIDDVYYPQARKASQIFYDVLNKEGFDVIYSDLHVSKNKTHLIFLFNRKELSLRRVPGPNFQLESAVQKFAEKHKKAIVFLEGDNFSAVEPSRFGSEEELIKEIISNPKAYGIPSGVTFQNFRITYSLPKAAVYYVRLKMAINKRLLE